MIPSVKVFSKYITSLFRPISKAPVHVSRHVLQYKREKQKSINAQQEIINLSNKLQKALGIDDATLKEMVYDGHSMHYGDYRLVFTTRCFFKWVDIIEVVPYALCSNHGYENTTYLENGQYGWHYILNGTRTECLPPEQVQDEVLKMIRYDIATIDKAEE